MQTNLAAFIRDTEQGREADRILRSCVHCGFCTATCPTYQLLGDELDGPRGRIYQIKQMLEGQPVSHTTQVHLDRCLTCLNCMTTCPSGVDYHHLVDIGREVVEKQVRRPLGQRLTRWGLRKVLPFPRRFAPLLALGRALRPLSPAGLRRKIPPRQAVVLPTDRQHARRMLILEGCVQPALTPRTNAVTREVLDRLGITLISAPGAGCCGAVSQHLSAPEEARAFMRRNIDHWWPQIEQGAEAILVTASGCGAMVKQYGYHLRNDPRYGEKAARVSALARDLGEVLSPQQLRQLGSRAPRRIAFHAPCTLQHGQGLKGMVEGLLTEAGFELLPVQDSHLCCGSAGTYSLLQPELSDRLRAGRLQALEAERPALIATANVGCQTHLQVGAQVPVLHWIELFASDFERAYPLPAAGDRAV